MTTNAERQAEFKAKMRKQGLALVAEWIPEKDRAHFKAYAKALRDGAQLPEPDTSNKPVSDNPLIRDILEDALRLAKKMTKVSKAKGTMGLFVSPYADALKEMIDRLADHKHPQIIALVATLNEVHGELADADGYRHIETRRLYLDEGAKELMAAINPLLGTSNN